MSVVDESTAVLPAAAARARRAPRSARPPRPPRRPPAPRRELAPLSSGQAFLRAALTLVAALLLAFLITLVAIGPIEHFAAQQQLRDTYRAQLEEGTAPVSEGDFDDVLLADGAPVGILSIPQLGIDEVIAEGTSSGVLKLGPGHRRDTVLPGQAGVSVIMGRAAAFGGPFARLQTLQPGDRFEVRTGQGLSEFEVMGLRYAGDATTALARGESRLILTTARGAPFVPTGVAYLDARLIGEAQGAGARQTTPVTLPPRDKALATDTSTVWALVFALQFLLAAELGAVWSFRRVGAQKTWIVFAPVLLLASLIAADQVTRLLPNLL